MQEVRRPVGREIIDALAAVQEHATSVAALIHYDLKDAVERFLLSYFATSIELAAGCIALANHTETIGIPILARSVLEAHVDFRCLLADPGYKECIEAAHDLEWAKVIDEAVAGGGAYLAKLGAEPAVLHERVKIAEREQLRASLGVRRLRAKQRFERAGMDEAYYSVYNFLCAEAHNDARALISRHIKEDAQGVIRLTIFGDDCGFVETGLMQVHDVLSAMTDAICKRFKIVEPDRSTVNATYEAARRVVAARDSSMPSGVQAGP